MLANSISQDARVPVVVDNKPGADGNIAATHVARAAPDGYTVLVTANATHAANASTFRSLPFDPKADFQPVAGLVKIPIILAVKADSAAGSITDLVTRARASARPLTFGASSQTGRGALLLQAVYRAGAGGGGAGPGETRSQGGLTRVLSHRPKAGDGGRPPA